MREYLSGLDGVTSIEVDVNAELLEDDRWMVNVALKDDPDLESVPAIVRDARNKVISIADADKVYMDVTWDQGATTVACHLLLNDAEKAVPVAVGAVSSDIERVSVSEESISLDYRSVKTLSDNFVLPSTSPVLQVSSLKTGQDVLVGGSYCFISHSRGIDLTSVPVKNVAFDMEAGAVVGSGEPSEQGAAILAAAQQAAASS